MKKLLLLAFMAICISGIIPSKVYAVDISVGATTWYAWWNWDGSDISPTIDPAFLYGPALFAKLNDDFNLTFVYLHGKFGGDWGTDTAFTAKRNDSDLALNYRLNDYFKLFVGIKYMNYTFSGKGLNIDHSSIGPGLGLSAVFPILENLFLLANISCIYLWGKDDEEGDFKEYGINSNLSIAYYIVPASIVISLGGRFQSYKTDYDDYFEKHKFYGATLSATYTFNI